MPTDRIAGLAQDHFDRGSAAMAEGRYRDAVEAFTKAIKLRPDVAAGYRYRAAAFRALNDRPSAITDLTEAIKRAPDDAQIRAERANEFLKQKQYDRAVVDCNVAMNLDPGRGDVYGMRAAAHGMRGDTPAALADFETAFKRDPDHAHEYLVARGRLFMELDDHDRAIQDATAALAVNDDHVPAYEMRAICRQKLKRSEAAEGDFREILAREPTNFAGLLGLALVLFEQKKWAESKAAADEVVKHNPRFNRGYELRGMSLENLERYDEALKEFTKAVELAPRDDSGYHLRAGVYLKLGQWSRAVAEHLEGLKRDPDDAQAMNYLAWLWACAPDDNLRDGKRALEFATRSCEQTEFNDAGCLDTLAAAHAECGDFEKAVAFAEMAIQKTDRDDDRAEFEQRLALFKDGRPHRLKAKSPH